MTDRDKLAERNERAIALQAHCQSWNFIKRPDTGYCGKCAVCREAEALRTPAPTDAEVAEIAKWLEADPVFWSLVSDDMYRERVEFKLPTKAVKHLRTLLTKITELEAENERIVAESKQAHSRNDELVTEERFQRNAMRRIQAALKEQP